MTGLVLGILGNQTDMGSAAPIVVAVALLAGGIVDLTGHRHALGRNRETSYTPGRAQRLRYLALNAATLGTGFATRVGFASLYGLALATVAVGSLPVALVVWGAYGATRAGAIGALVLVLRTRTPLELLQQRAAVVRAVGLTTVVFALGTAAGT